MKSQNLSLMDAIRSMKGMDLPDGLGLGQKREKREKRELKTAKGVHWAETQRVETDETGKNVFERERERERERETLQR